MRREEEGGGEEGEEEKKRTDWSRSVWILEGGGPDAWRLEADDKNTDCHLAALQRYLVFSQNWMCVCGYGRHYQWWVTGGLL